MAHSETIAAHIASGKWRELSTLDRYLDISVEMLAETGQSYFAGPNHVISQTAEVTDSILWDNVEIGAGASVCRCVIGDSVIIARGERIENSIVVRRDLVEGKKRPDKALPGDFRGENFVVPL
jgi:ADP-glucose pyrophosphorylase